MEVLEGGRCTAGAHLHRCRDAGQLHTATATIQWACHAYGKCLCVQEPRTKGGDLRAPRLLQNTVKLHVIIFTLCSNARRVTSFPQLRQQPTLRGSWCPAAAAAAADSISARPLRCRAAAAAAMLPGTLSCCCMVSSSRSCCQSSHSAWMLPSRPLVRNLGMCTHTQ